MKEAIWGMGIRGRGGRGRCREDLLLCGRFGIYSHPQFRGLQAADAEYSSGDSTAAQVG